MHPLSQLRGVSEVFLFRKGAEHKFEQVAESADRVLLLPKLNAVPPG
jgi:hypothetical protein